LSFPKRIDLLISAIRHSRELRDSRVWLEHRAA
jgi:hypothetical protein